MTMADAEIQDGALDQPDATGGEDRATSGAAQTQPAPAALTPEQARDLMREVVEESNARHWAAMRQYTDNALMPVRDKMAMLDAVPQLAEHLTTLTGSVKQTRALFQRFAAGQMAEEDYATLQKGVEESLQAEQERDELALRRKADAARAATEEARRTAPQPVAQADPQVVLDQQYQQFYAPLAERLAKVQGLTFRDIQDRLPAIRLGATKADWESWTDKVESLTAEIADERRQAAKPRTNVPSERSGRGGGGKQSAYALWLKGEGPQPSSEEIDRETARWMGQRTG